MNHPPDAPGVNVAQSLCQQVDRQEALSRLRRQAWGAGLLLLTPWLLTIACYRLIFRDNPTAIPALFPGLLVAIYLGQNLFRHLSSNHRPSEDGLLFPTLGLANWISLLRAGAVVALAGFLPFAIKVPDPANLRLLTWAAGILYLGISLADLGDGYAARKQGRETALGKRLDIETDAAGLLVASLVAVALGRLPVIYLLVGLAYYPFIIGIRLRQRRGLPVVDLQPRPYSRIIAGCQMGLVGMAFLPIFHPAFTFVAAYIFMTPLLLGFLRDWLVISCRIITDGDQQAGVDRWAHSLMLKVPLLLRLIILALGIKTFVAPGVSQVPLAWQLVPGLCCLAAAVGFWGRSAGLLLVLLLGANQSPFGISLIPLLLFGTAAALVLSGTGTMSLWAPEDRILYDRGKDGFKKDGQAR